MERGATGRLGFWSGGKQAIVELAGRRRERPWLNSVDVRGVRVMSSPREHGAAALVGLAQPFARPRHRGALLSGALCVSCVRAGFRPHPRCMPRCMSPLSQQVCCGRQCRASGSTVHVQLRGCCMCGKFQSRRRRRLPLPQKPRCRDILFDICLDFGRSNVEDMS